MSELEHAILDQIARWVTVVVPSEVAAAFWRRRALPHIEGGAIREDAVVSWDTFKERAFDLRSDLTPVNRTLRTIFARRVIAENATAPFLTTLIPGKFAGEADGFLRHIVATLPSLPEFGRLVRRASDGLARLGRDLLEIRRRYEAFMGDAGLFEPGWLETVPAYQGGAHFLVMPELTEDHPQFRDALAGVPSYAVPRGCAGRLIRYPDARQELQDTCRRVASLLDAGVRPDDIVLTVGGLDRVTPRVTQAGELYDIPLLVRQGTPLNRSGPGRFLAALGEAAGDSFSVSAMKRLLLNRSVPWKSYDDGARLVLVGAQIGAVGGMTTASRWRRVEEADLRDLAGRFTRGIPPIVGAKTATAMRAALRRFMDQVIDGERWSDADEAVLQRCLIELRGLCEIEREYRLTVDDPYRFWMDRLGELLYVPRTGRTGVSVLPYRVSAAMAPAHHFVINAHHAATSVRVAPFGFLTEDQQELLGDGAKDRDLSPLFLGAYAVSGGQVRFSYGEVGFDGPTLPPGLFVAQGAIEPGRADWDADPYVAEERGRAGALEHPLPLQREGVAAYAATGPRQGPDFTSQTVDRRDVRQALFSRQHSRRHPDLVSISAHDLDLFRTCRFSYLLARGLDIQELDYEVDPDNPREIGSHYHNVLQMLFGRIADRGEAFSPASVEEYVAEAVEISDSLSARSEGMIPDAVLRAYRPLYRRVLASVLERDASYIDLHRPEMVEAWEHHLEKGAGSILIGRVDRVTRGPDGGLTLVDYKKNSIPSAKGINGNSPDPVGTLARNGRCLEAISGMESIQIPFYVLLIEAGGERVRSAYFYSLEGATARPVFDETGVAARPAMSRGRLDEILALVDGAVREMVESVRAGDYRCAPVCDGCAFRGICRTRFVVR